MAGWSSSDSRFKVTGPTLENRSMVDVVSSHVALKTGAKMLLIRLAMPLNDIFCSLRKPPCSSAQLGMFPKKCRKQSLKPLCRDSQWNIRKDDTEKKYWCLYNDLFCTHIFQLTTGTEMYLHSTGKYLFQRNKRYVLIFLVHLAMCRNSLFEERKTYSNLYISWTLDKEQEMICFKWISFMQLRRYTYGGARAECSRLKTGARRQATSHRLKLLMKLQGPPFPEQDQPWRWCIRASLPYECTLKAYNLVKKVSQACDELSRSFDSAPSFPNLVKGSSSWRRWQRLWCEPRFQTRRKRSSLTKAWISWRGK